MTVASWTLTVCYAALAAIVGQGLAAELGVESIPLAVVCGLLGALLALEDLDRIRREVGG